MARVSQIARWFLRRVIVPPVEAVSMALMYLGSGGMLQISLCACAWMVQFRPWVWTFDRVFRLYERDHCKASFRRCW